MLPPNIDVSPHSIDFSIGSIYYDNEIFSDDLSAVLFALKSNIPINRVESHGLSSLNLQGLITFVNSSLTSLDFSDCGLSDPYFLDIISVIQPHCCLKKLNFSCNFIGLDGFVTVSKLVVAGKISNNLQISPHFLDVKDGVFSFSPETLTEICGQDVSSLCSLFKHLSVKNLVLKRCLFSEEVIVVLCDLIRECISLTSIDFSFSDFCDDQFSQLVSSLQFQSGLTQVNLSSSSIRFNSLLTVFELVSARKLTPNVRVFPHSIDISLGSVSYKHVFEQSDSISLLNALKSNILIKRVECRGLRSLRLRRFIDLFELFSISKSVLDLDISPHSIDVESGVFCFNPVNSVQLTGEEFLSVQSFWKSYTIKQLTLKNCDFTKDAFTGLCDLLNVTTSLTLIDISNCDLTCEQISQVICLMHLSFRLEAVNLSNNFITLQNLLHIFELFTSAEKIPNFTVYPHDIDFSTASILYSCEVDNYDLISLLNAMKSNIPINRVFCHPLSRPSLQELITLFEVLSVNKFVLVLPHSSRRRLSDYEFYEDFIDIDYGTIHCDNMIENSDLSALLKALKSSVPIKHVECRGLKRPSLEGLIALNEILSINKSVIGKKISKIRYNLDVENGVFCFSPKFINYRINHGILHGIGHGFCRSITRSGLTADTVSFFSQFLELYRMKTFILKKCRLNFKTITALCDLLKENHWLTSIDFSSCNLSGYDAVRLATAVQSNLHLKLSMINLQNNSIGNMDAFTVVDTLKFCTSVTNIDLRYNFIDSNTKQLIKRILNNRVTC
ncbi:hypothetical protein GEMRC1_009673 [Eukaryota sp. GEM-RC1]